MDGFSLLYNITFWILPAFLLMVVLIWAVTGAIHSLRLRVQRRRRVLVCPASRQEAGVELLCLKRPGLPPRYRVVRCTELPEGPVLCSQACLRFEENRTAIELGKLDEEEWSHISSI